MSRLESKLEAEGAEFMVLGHLLIERIPAYKAYTNMSGYDLVATDPDHNTSARIQVKSRWATDFDGGFPIRNFNCDFVVFVALNRGYRYSRRRAADADGKRPPQFYVFPVDLVIAAQKRDSAWGKVFVRHIPNADTYVARWDLIREFLQKPDGAGATPMSDRTQRSI